jgi:hypothetical protein
MQRLMEERSSHACQTGATLSHACSARLIVHGGLDNSSDKDIEELYPEGGPVD